MYVVSNFVEHIVYKIIVIVVVDCVVLHNIIVSLYCSCVVYLYVNLILSSLIFLFYRKWCSWNCPS